MFSNINLCIRSLYSVSTILGSCLYLLIVEPLPNLINCLGPRKPVFPGMFVYELVAAESRYKDLFIHFQGNILELLINFNATYINDQISFIFILVKASVGSKLVTSTRFTTFCKI